jgi:LacI family gluconate utilization system Gnt-I transcriptional repressor
MPETAPKQNPPALPNRSARRRRRSSGAITLTDVARLAGVSPITASRALNAPDTVAPETLARVREAIVRTGYVPNLIAGGLASARSRLVAALVPTIAGPFVRSIEALTQSLEQAGYQLMLGQTGYSQAREDALLEAIISRRPDAIVLTGVLRSPGARKRLIASGIPVVETWDLTPTPVDMVVGFSHERAGEAVADYLLTHGRKLLAIVTADDVRAERRARAFVDTVRRQTGTENCTIEVVAAPGTVGAGRTGLAAVLDKAPDTDAVFCSSDPIALGVLIEAQARGVLIPEQLGVVGLGDLDFAADTEPALTTVRIDGTAIGREAANFIVARARGESPQVSVLDIGFELVERESA